MNTWSKPHRGDRTWPGTWSFRKIHMDGKGIWQSHFRRKNRVREETDGVNLAWEETMRQPPEWDSGPHHSLQPQFWTVHLQWLCSLLFQPDVPVSFHAVSFPRFLLSLPDRWDASSSWLQLESFTSWTASRPSCQNLSRLNVVPGIHPPKWCSCQNRTYRKQTHSSVIFIVRCFMKAHFSRKPI